jgi:hypothetical protein
MDDALPETHMRRDFILGIPERLNQAGAVIDFSCPDVPIECALGNCLQQVREAFFAFVQ